jgi:glutathione S-transferase
LWYHISFNIDIHPIQNLRVLKKVGEIAGEDQKLIWAKHFIQLGLESFEQFLSKSAGKYCVGDTLSLADVFLVPQCYNAVRYQKVKLDLGLIWNSFIILILLLGDWLDLRHLN